MNIKFFIVKIEYMSLIPSLFEIVVGKPEVIPFHNHSKLNMHIYIHTPKSFILNVTSKVV